VGGGRCPQSGVCFGKISKYARFLANNGVSALILLPKMKKRFIFLIFFAFFERKDLQSEKKCDIMKTN
jgi:hypothetical protein